MDVCPTCGDEFSAIGSHWSQSVCEYPDLDERQRDIVTGIVMGDGTIRRNGYNPRLQVYNTSRRYLEYVDEVLGIYSHGIRIHQTAAESAENLQDRGFSSSATEDSCSDLYVLYTTSSPVFDQFARWYGDDGKVFPETLNLNPTVLKHWFVCDGDAYEKCNSHYIRIAMCNEHENTDKIESYFDDIGISVSCWDKGAGSDGSDYCRALFNVEASKELIAYMGDPLPGFAYKWPDKYGPADTVDVHG